MFFRRKVKFFFQRLFRGWDDSDCWSLDYTIAKFALPRLERFRGNLHGYPGNLTSEEWESILDDMIYGLQACIHNWWAEEKVTIDNVVYEEGEDIEWDWDRVQKGLDYFGKYFRDLWD